VRFLFKSILRVKSFSEFKRKFFGYLEMIFSQENASKRDENFVAYHEGKKRLDFYWKIAKFK